MDTQQRETYGDLELEANIRLFTFLDNKVSIWNSVLLEWYAMFSLEGLGVTLCNLQQIPKAQCNSGDTTKLILFEIFPLEINSCA